MSQLTRRRFIYSTAAAASLSMLPITRNALGANEKLNIGCIGVGGRGGADMKGVLHENVIALCDIDARTLGKAAQGLPNAKQFRDYRRMLDQLDKELDAVTVGTPDHTHAPATLRAIAAGKHVYCEKPLTHTVREAQLVGAATKKHNVVTQMGTQIHAGDNYRRVVEAIQSGVIGDVTRVHTWIGGNGYHGGDRPTAKPPVPKHVDWDLWLGPAPHRPYHTKYHPFNWRGWWDFGGGTLADMACHHMDVAFWALGLRNPTSVEVKAGPKLHEESTPQFLIVDYHYPARSKSGSGKADDAGHRGFLGKGSKFPGGPAVDLSWYHGGKRPEFLTKHKINWGAGNLFEGTKGKLITDYGRHQFYTPDGEPMKVQAPEPFIPKTQGHHREWTEACKTGGVTTCNFDYAASLTEAVLLGNVAFRAGDKFEWDHAKGKSSSDKSNAWLDKVYRKGWEVEGVV